MWVRSDTAGAKVYLRMREYQGSTKLAEQLIGVRLTTSWQNVTASLTPIAAGQSTLDFSAAVYSAPPGTCFYADDAALRMSPSGGGGGGGADAAPTAQLSISPTSGTAPLAVT